MHQPLITFILPTLGRRAGVDRCVDSINKLNYPEEKKELLIIEDEPRLGVPTRVHQGVSLSKGEYLVYAANDMEFKPDCIVNALKHKNALVAFNCGSVLPDEGNICEHFVIRKDFLPQIGGKIFDTDFNHTGVDNLLWEKCKKLNEAFWCIDAKAIHYHYSRTGEEMDEGYKLAWDQNSLRHDRELLVQKIKKLGTNPKWLFTMEKWLEKV